MDFIAASSLLNWSYQNTKACTVLVGENSDGFPASKATTSETNLSTSSRPRPSSSGGNNEIEGVYARKRREVNVTPHAFVLFSNVSTSSSPMDNVSSAAPLHDSTVLSSTEMSLASDVNNAAVTNSVSKSLETTTTIFDNFTSVETTVFENTNITMENSDTTPNPEQITEVTSEQSEAQFKKEEDINEPLKDLNSQIITTISEVSNMTVQQDNNEKNVSNEMKPQVDDHLTIEEILDAKIDYEKAFGPDYDDSDDDSLENNNSPTNLTSEVIKIDKETVEEMRQPPQINQLTESISMKTSSEAIQHDYPVYAYGQDEVQIVNLNHETISTTAKSKAVYDHPEVPPKPEVQRLTSSEELTDFNLAAEEFDLADVINIKSDTPVLQTHEINATNTNSVASETNVPSKISVIEVPTVHDGLMPSKRILVNVTIATEPDSPHSPQSVYVLSVSLPTENNPSPDVSVNSQSEKRYQNSSSHHESTKNEILAPEESKNYGGECQCSCPCLDPETSPSPSLASDVTVQNATDLLSSTTETTILETSDSTTTDETWTTTPTQCPEITTTSIPPTPMILILEGRMLIRKT